MQPPNEVDVIIAGGGAAGCVVAGRLAAADPNLEILVIEQGRNNFNDDSVIRPAYYLSHLKPGSTTAKFYAGRPSEHLGGRSPIVPTGNILGGGSSINFMAYARASGSDFDDWATEGWSRKDLVPLLQKIETYGPEIGDKDVHGYNGPLKVSYAHEHKEVMEDFLHVVKQRGYRIVNDLQDTKTVNAFERWKKWISPETGRRSDAAHGYLHPQVGKTKLQVLCDSKISRVIVENGKAVGVEYVPAIPPNSTDIPEAPEPKTVRARKLVVVSAGALGSPQILERSGIGNPEILRKAGIEPIVDLPGVGSSYQDHNLILCPYRVAPNVATQDDFLRGIPKVLEEATEDFKKGKGIMTANFVDVGSKLRPNEAELEKLGPEFRKIWDKFFKDAPDKPVMVIAMISTFLGDHSLVPPGHYVTMAAFLEYPASRGTLHITSKNPYANPDFDPGFLSHKADLTPSMWAYKLGREILRRMRSYRGELAAFHPKFSPTSAVACRELDVETSEEINAAEVASGVALPVPSGPTALHLPTKQAGAPVEDLVYSEEDDKALEQWVRENVQTTWHSLGTNPMKPREKGGVVDAKLNVYGVENLKVADLSICPGNVGANTYNTALVVGEKAALLCGEFLGISV